MSNKKKNTKNTGKSKNNSKKFMEDLKQFIRTEGQQYLRDKNITSIGIGYKKKDNKQTNEISIQFTVETKTDVPEELESLDTKKIPRSIPINGIDVPTDVLQRKYKHDFKVVAETETNLRKIRNDPIVPGISVANIKETAGTIGCIVFDQHDGTPYILSNWHVLNGPHGDIGDTIVQPGPYDDNRVDINNLGKLIRSYLGIAGDCAIASIETRSYKKDIFDLNTGVEQLGEPDLGDKVIKSGRTTGVTHGIITRIHTIVKLNYGDPVGEKEIGCFEIGPDNNFLPENGEITTGGDSGSAWLLKTRAGKPSKIIAGLHFAGEGPGDPNEHALACYAKSVFEKLEIVPTLSKEIEKKNKTGYNNSFLTKKVDLPKLNSSNSKKAFKLNNSELIDYTHFSLALNKNRRFAFYVGWNINGNSIKKVSRKGISFKFDPQIPSKYQVGENLYHANPVDRGHIARRADLVWGNLSEAKKANKDSFFFTNIVPQMNDFNQGKLGGIWGKLEDAIFEEVEVEDLKVSVIGGPVFRENDREYRDVKIPRECFKVIIYIESGELKTKAFLLTQNLDELELLDLNEFKIYQVTLSEVEKRCGFKFPDNLKEADGFQEHLSNIPESITEREPLSSLKDIIW